MTDWIKRDRATEGGKRWWLLVDQ